MHLAATDSATTRHTPQSGFETASSANSGRRFMVVDDHPIMRDAIGQTLAMLSPGCHTEMTASLAETRRRLALGTNYDCVLFDLGLPDTNGFDGLSSIRDLRPDLPIVVMSGDIERDTIIQCLDLGAVGYIPKTMQADVIMNALRMIVAGHIYVPHELVTGGPLRTSDPIRLRRQACSDPRKMGLTERQIDVLRLILRGLPNKLICRELELAEGTVKVHVSAVLRALGVRNRTQAVIAASQMGLKVNH